jgi:hypothetical protein
MSASQGDGWGTGKVCQPPRGVKKPGWPTRSQAARLIEPAGASDAATLGKRPAEGSLGLRPCLYIPAHAQDGADQVGQSEIGVLPGAVMVVHHDMVGSSTVPVIGGL